MDETKFVQAINESRNLIKSGRYDACPCSQAECEWHGKCFECVMIHRVKGKHLPECLQPIFRETITDLARKVELGVVDARPTEEHREYLKKVSPPAKDE
ncbi:MAG: hypothetical protein ABH834_07995 [Candidatus Altiarchaeota archaeon]